MIVLTSHWKADSVLFGLYVRWNAMRRGRGDDGVRTLGDNRATGRKIEELNSRQTGRD